MPDEHMYTVMCIRGLNNSIDSEYILHLRPYIKNERIIKYVSIM